jgi:hypothetical protein
MSKIAISAALAALFAAGSLAVPAAWAVDKPRTAESIACSKEADTKGLHGKPRKEFRKTCIKAASKGKAGAT